MFQQIEIADWRQFKKIQIDFHPQLTVLTGANGAGKTTILNLLNRHFGWSMLFVSTPKQTKGPLKYFSDLWLFFTREESIPGGSTRIGQIFYTNGKRATLTVPHSVGQEYQVDIIDQQSVSGLFIPSHRPVYVYQTLSSIPTTVSARDQLFDVYVSELRNTYASLSRPRSASYRIKEALVSLATFGYGNDAVAPNHDAIQTFEGFGDILSKVLPDSLGFRKIKIRMPEVVLDTGTGEFSLDAVSGGVSAIIDMSWQIYMASLIYGKFCVIIDEPENHLHPTLQKRLLPNFLKAFPDVQFIVATHNPFMVGSVQDSNVYALKYDEDQPNRVSSDLLDLINKAGSSNEILRDALGLEHTKPIWVELRMNQILERHLSTEINEESLASLKKEMEQFGISYLFPDALSRVMSRTKRA